MMRTPLASFDLLMTMARHGNPASASDAGVGAICARAAVRGAWLNVRTNLGRPSTSPRDREDPAEERRQLLTRATRPAMREAEDPGEVVENEG